MSALLDELNDILSKEPADLDVTYRGVRVRDMPADTARRLLALEMERELKRTRDRKSWWESATPEQKAVAVAASRVGADI